MREIRRLRWAFAAAAIAMAISLSGASASRADTVASLLGNFTINQFCGLSQERDWIGVHYVVVFGQLPALRELHRADTDGDGVTSQAERDAYVAALAPQLAREVELRVDGVRLPLRVTGWRSSLPTEQGGFSLRIDVELAATLPAAAPGARRRVDFANGNYAGRMGWHEIVVQPAGAMSIFDTNAYSTSLTGGLSEALQSLPAAGPLDEREVHWQFTDGALPPRTSLLAPRPGTTAAAARAGAPPPGGDTAWIARETRRLLDAISGPNLQPGVAMLALLGALLLGAVHALSPGHGKTLVGAYLIGSRGTARHAAFLGLTVTVTHTVGVFILGFATLYASRFIVPERLFPILSLVSAVLVLAMGVVLLVQRGRVVGRAMGRAPPAMVFSHIGTPGAGAGAGLHGAFPHTGLLWAHGHPHGHDHPHDHGDGTLHSHGGRMHSHLPPGAAGERVSWRSLLALGISGGLVPCPSALVLLLASVALNKTAYGMLLVLSFSVGLAITLTAVGMAFLYARNRFGQGSSDRRWTQILPVLSAGTITAVGLVLCVEALRAVH